MAKIIPVQNKKPAPPSTSGFPKNVANKKPAKPASVPMSKMGGKMSKGKMC